MGVAAIEVPQRGPSSHPARGRWHPYALAVPLAALVLLACAAGAAAGPPRFDARPGTAHGTGRAVGGRAEGSPGGCTVPALPPAGRPSGGATPPLAGPAVQALHGGPARSSFRLDGGAFVAAPPLPGQRPLVPARHAECAALAAIDIDGAPLVAAALQSGLVIGYARVSIVPRLLAHPQPPPALGAVEGEAVARPLEPPSPTPYRQRLAWVVVFREELTFHCPALLAPAPAAAAAPTPDAYSYGVFLMDARTGSDALLYVEGYPAPCGGRGHVAPTVSVPLDQISVPWRLASRSPDGYAGRIRAIVLPCDQYPGVVLVERARPAVRVVVLRPVDASCGGARSVTLALHAATVVSDLPAHIAHAPLGLYIPSPASPGPPTPPGVLQTLGPAQGGRTVHIRVGDVVAVALPGVRPGARSPVRSSAPAVLGPLDGLNRGPVAEFRAWHAGRAVLSIPAAACRPPRCSTAPFPRRWVVRVDIT